MKYHNLVTIKIITVQDVTIQKSKFQLCVHCHEQLAYLVQIMQIELLFKRHLRERWLMEISSTLWCHIEGEVQTVEKSYLC